MKGHSVPRLQAEEVQHMLVHESCAETAPEGDGQRPVIGESQLLPGLLPGLAEEVAPHRCAGDHDLLRVLIVLAALLEAHHDAPGIALQHFSGETGDHVGLVDCRGDALLGGVFHHGIAGVAAGTHHQIGAEIPEDGTGSGSGQRQIFKAFHVVGDARRGQGPLEAGDLDGAEVVPRLFDESPLHATGRSHEQHPQIRMPLLHIARQRQRRVHMARRAAAGKDHVHIASS